jgi:hypothetical protein
LARELILEVVARKNSKELNALADDFEKLARKSDTAGKSMRKTASFSQHLDGEITKTRKTIRELGQEFDRTGNKDVFAKLRGAQANLRSLETIKRDLVKAFTAAGDDSAKSFWRRFGSSKAINNGLTNALGNSLGDAGVVWQVAGPALVAAAPAVGAQIGGALLVGIGLAGIGAGIAGQIHNPLVMSEAKDLGKQVSTGFKDATASFQEPVLAGLRIIAGEWDRIRPGLKKTFTDLAPLSTTLANGVAGFIDKLVPGLERAAIASKPLITDFSIWLPKLGSELTSFFSAIASHEAEAQQGLHILTGTLDLVIMQLTTATHLGSVAFDWGVPQTTKSFFDWLAKGKQFDGVVRSLNEAGDAAASADSQLTALAAQIGQTKVSADSLAGTMADKVFSSLMNMDQANLSVASSLLQVSAALKQNKRDLNIHHDAGIADRQAILGAVQANIAQYDSLIQAGAGADQAAAAYDANTAALERQLRKAGLTQAQVDGLIGKYRQVPGKVNTLIAIQGLTDAINKLADLIAGLNHINGRHVRTYVDQYVSVHQGGSGPSRNKPISNAYGGVVIPAASGLAYGAGIYPASSPPMIKFAEPQTGGEALIPRRGIAAARGLALADTAASWYGGAVMPRGGRGGGRIEHTLRVAGGGDTAVGTMIRTLLRTGVLTIDSRWVI